MVFYALGEGNHEKLAFRPAPAKENPTFLVAQYKALSSQIPVLYILLVINALAVAITHIHTAPMWLALYVPVGLSVLCVFPYRLVADTRPGLHQRGSGL